MRTRILQRVHCVLAKSQAVMSAVQGAPEHSYAD
jgi:hypothetical protein